MVNNKVVITGGSGFIGTNLITFFLEQGWEILNIDIAPPRNPEQFNYWKEVNLLDRDQLIKETLSFQPSVFLHFGARTDLNEQQNIDGYAANTEGVCNVIEAIRSTRSIQQVIFASSQLVCKLGYSPIDNFDYLPTTLYGKSKVFSEKIVRAADDIGAIWTILRPTSLWGPWFDVPYKNFFTAIARNLYLHPGGVTIPKQWGFISNSVFQIWEIIHSSAEKVHKKIFYLADYPPIYLRDFADQVQVCFGSRPIRTVPSNVLKSAARMGDVLQHLGWKNPPLTSFRYRNIITSEVHNLTSLEQIVGPLPFSAEQGIEITVNWLREHWN